MAAQLFDLEIRALLSQRVLVAKYLKKYPNVRIFKLKLGNKDVIIDKAKVCREIIRRKAISGLSDESKSSPNKLIGFIASPSNTKIVEQALRSLISSQPQEEATSPQQAVEEVRKQEKEREKKEKEKKQDKSASTSSAKIKKSENQTSPGLGTAATNKAKGLSEKAEEVAIIKKISQEDKEAAAYFQSKRINEYANDIKTELGRIKLLHNKVFAQDELDTILSHGLVADADMTTAKVKLLHNPSRFLNPDGSVNQHLWDKANYEAAASILERRALVKLSQKKADTKLRQEERDELINKLPPPRSDKRWTTLSTPKPTVAQTTSRVKAAIPYPIKNGLKNLLSFGKIQARKLIYRFPKAFIAGGVTGATALFASQGNLLAAAGGFAAGAVGYQLIADSQNSSQTPPVLNNEQTIPQNAPSTNPNQRNFSNPLTPFNNARKGISALRGAATAARAGVLLTNPTFWVVIAILILILLVVIILNPGGGDGTTSPTSQASVTIKKDGPAAVNNGDSIGYSIEINYIGPGSADIEVTDQLDTKSVKFISADNEGKEEIAETGLIKWRLKNIPSNIPKKLSLIVKPIANDIWVINNASAQISRVIAPAGSSDISSCQFFRGDHKPQGAIYKSNLLINYFNEASQISGIPVKVLAGFARVESPSVTSRTDSEISSLGCARSPTGALGLMQLQPAGTTGHCRECVALGASYLGKKVDDLTERDYCDVKSSIIMASGFLIKKMEYAGYKNNGKWNPEWTSDKNAVYKMVEGYYGCLKYPSCSSGPFNYGEDVWQSVTSCQEKLVQSTNKGGAPSACQGEISVFDATKLLLPLPSESLANGGGTCYQTVTNSCGRPGSCTKPNKIVIHTTASTLNGQNTANYFANGSANRGVAAHFIIDKGGQTLQLVETFADKVEIAYAVAGYSDHISIELVHNGIYSNKPAMPAAQYDSLIRLVRDLMRQYSIGVGSLEYDWKANGGASDRNTNQSSSGIYGHYQLNPVTRSDPGEGLLRDLREELKR